MEPTIELGLARSKASLARTVSRSTGPAAVPPSAPMTESRLRQAAVSSTYGSSRRSWRWMSRMRAVSSARSR
jgi:hypothetical protein